MTTWPKPDAASMNAFYGNPDTNRDGSPDASWEAANITRLIPPYGMVLAWDTSKTVSGIRVHRKCAESLGRALGDILNHYGSQAAVEAARMHLYGGAYTFRLKRGGSTLSNHSWGSAIDLDPANNGFGRVWKPNTSMMPMAVVEIFKARGWGWGGLWGTADAMHFEAVTR